MSSNDNALYKYTLLAATGSIKTGPTKLGGIFVTAASVTPTIKIYDSPDTSGNVVVNTFTPVAGTWYPLPFNLNVGCNVVIGGTVACTVAWN